MLFRALEGVLGERVSRDADFGARTTYRVGGTADLWLSIGSMEELVAVSKVLGGCDDLALMVFGAGSNLIVADAGYRGIVIQLVGEFRAITQDRDLVHLGSSVLLPVAARQLAAAGRGGFEWAVGIPGTVGGAVTMNAGGHGSEMREVLLSAEVLDLRGEGPEVTSFGPSELKMAYRFSAIGDAQVVCGANIQTTEVDPSRAKATVSEIVRWRRLHQPGGQNAGSVFVNPPGSLRAAELIEQAGCKGLRHGSAQVSEKHANFIQSQPGGSADDVAALMDLVRQIVLDRCSVELHSEIRRVGFED